MDSLYLETLKTQILNIPYEDMSDHFLDSMISVLTELKGKAQYIKRLKDEAFFKKDRSYICTHDSESRTYGKAKVVISKDNSSAYKEIDDEIVVLGNFYFTEYFDNSDGEIKPFMKTHCNPSVFVACELSLKKSEYDTSKTNVFEIWLPFTVLEF